MTTEAVKPLAYGIDSYLEWIKREGLLVHEGLALNLMKLETRDWPRFGVDGAALHFKGSGDFCSMFLMDIGAGKATNPIQHVFEAIYYVFEGRGSTQLEFSDGTTRSFEWGPRSFFAIPLNAKYRHFNASGTERALLAVTTTAPLMMKIFHNERFIFDLPFDFTDRIGKEAFFTGQGDLHMVRPGNNMWETNFVPDLGELELTSWDDRGKGSKNIIFALGDGIMHAHMSEIPPAMYKKAHRHIDGAHVLSAQRQRVLAALVSGARKTSNGSTGNTASSFRRRQTSFTSISSRATTHRATSRPASAECATPLTEEHRRIALGKPGEKQSLSLSVKDGGDQIEFTDQDPRIHEIWREEMRKNGIPSDWDPTA